MFSHSGWRKRPGSELEVDCSGFVDIDEVTSFYSHSRVLVGGLRRNNVETRATKENEDSGTDTNFSVLARASIMEHGWESFYGSV